MKINNTMLMLSTHMILLSSFVIFLYSICYLGGFPTVFETGFKLRLRPFVNLAPTSDSIANNKNVNKSHD